MCVQKAAEFMWIANIYTTVRSNISYDAYTH